MKKLHTLSFKTWMSYSFFTFNFPGSLIPSCLASTRPTSSSSTPDPTARRSSAEAFPSKSLQHLQKHSAGPDANLDHLHHETTTTTTTTTNLILPAKLTSHPSIPCVTLRHYLLLLLTFYSGVVCSHTPWWNFLIFFDAIPDWSRRKAQKQLQQQLQEQLHLKLFNL